MRKIDPKIQRALGVQPDGRRGPNTIKAIKAFQRSQGLTVDGIAGGATRAKLFGTKAPKFKKPVPVNKVQSKGIKLRKTRRPIREIIIHCASTPEGREHSVKDIDAWHRQRGWSEIGYHYVVHLDGSVSRGRSVNKIGAHVRGKNTGTIGICYIGGTTKGKQLKDRRAKDTRTKAQKETLYRLTKDLARMYNVKKVSGHDEYANKACPSFNVKSDPLSNIPNIV